MSYKKVKRSHPVFLILLSVFLIIVIVLIIRVFQTTNSIQSTTSSTMEIDGSLTYNKDGISFKYPSSWKASETTSNSKTTTYFGQYMIFTSEPYNEEGICQGSDISTVSNIQKSIISGVDVTQCNTLWSKNIPLVGGEQTFDTFIHVKNRLFDFTLTDMSFKDYYDHILSTINVVN